jgi:hypothetical protein
MMIRSLGYAACMGEIINAYYILIGKTKGKGPTGKYGIILKWDFSELSTEMSNEVARFKICISTGLLWSSNVPRVFLKGAEFLESLGVTQLLMKKCVPWS